MFRYTVVMVSALVWAAAVTPALAQGQPKRQGPNVTVVNTAANPIPVVVPEPLAVTGTVGVEGSVTVSDTAKTAYVEYAGGTIASGWVNVQLNLGVVPEGKRLVVEHVGAACEMSASDEITRATIWINKKVGAGWSSFAVPLGVVSKLPTYDGKTSASVSQSLRLYSDGGVGGVFVDIRRRDTAQEANCWAVVSGYTVDAP